MNAQNFPILIRREFWEHRVLWIAPLVPAVLYVLLCLVPGGVDPGHVNINSRHVGPEAGSLMMGLYVFSTGILFALTSCVLFFYLADCLYAERKDRSILFWKSLPVSDASTVLAKLVVALIIVPVGVYVLSAVVNALAFGILYLRFHGNPAISPFVSLDVFKWLRMVGVLGVDMLIIALWYAPLAGYQLLVSAWAKGSVFVWTVLPPLVVVFAERFVFGTWNAGTWILSRLFFGVAGIAQAKRVPTDVMLSRVDGAGLTTDPQFYIGLAIAAALVFAAIRIRRYRDDT